MGEQEGDDDLVGDPVCAPSRLPRRAREARRVGGNEGRDEVLQRLGQVSMRVCRPGSRVVGPALRTQRQKFRGPRQDYKSIVSGSACGVGAASLNSTPLTVAPWLSNWQRGLFF